MNFKDWLLVEGEHRFSCVLVLLESLEKSIQKWSEENIAEDLLFEAMGGRETESHVTALYGLHTSRPQEIEPIIEEFEPFEIKLGKVSKFESTKYDVIKLDVSGEKLFEMNKSLKKLPYSTDHPNYVPHCTLAYVEKNSCDHLIGDKFFVGKTAEIDKIVFSSPDGKKTHFKLKKNLTESFQTSYYMGYL